MSESFCGCSPISILPKSNRLEGLQGAEINEAKKVLADAATTMAHGEQAAVDAAETARKTFEQGGAGDQLPTHTSNGPIATPGRHAGDWDLSRQKVRHGV
jgi:tyrosyl-tRNA synthetase